MKKIKVNKHIFYVPMLLALWMLLLTIVLFTTSCSAAPSEVVKVNKELMASHSWEEAVLDIDCIDSLQCQGDYYWAIYDSPDQFEEVLCLSMNKKTYKVLKSLLDKEASKNHPYIDIDDEYLDRFHIYYGHCEEVVLMFE